MTAQPRTAAAREQAVQRTLAASDGRLQRRDTTSGRFYVIPDQDEPVPSVTHVLSCLSKPALVKWAATQERTLVMDTAADLYLDLAQTPPMSRPSYLATLRRRLGTSRAHQRQLATAAAIGSQAHALVEWNLRRSMGQEPGPEPHVGGEARWAFAAFQRWADEVSLRPIHIEQMVYSRTHGYAGTMDLLAEVDGVIQLVDFKTGKAVYRESHLQNVAYQQALIEMGHQEPEGGLIVRLPKVQTDPAFEVVTVAPRATSLPVFLHLLEVWRWWHAGEVAYQRARAARSQH